MLKRLTIFVVLMLSRTLWALGAPILILPDSASNHASIVTFQFQSSTSDAQFDRFQIATDANFITLVKDTVWLNGTWTSPGGLLAVGRTYYWRVQSGKNPSTWGPWSSVWWFTVTHSTGIFSQLSFPDSASNQTTPITFAWNVILEGDTPINFQLEISIHSSFDILAFNIVTSTDPWTSPSGFLAAGAYYWRVRAEGTSQNWSDWSTVWPFTVTQSSEVVRSQPLVRTSPIVSTGDAISYSLLGRRILSDGAIAKSPSLYIYRTNDRTTKKMMLR